MTATISPAPQARPEYTWGYSQVALALWDLTSHLNPPNRLDIMDPIDVRRGGFECKPCPQRPNVNTPPCSTIYTVDKVIVTKESLSEPEARAALMKSIYARFRDGGFVEIYGIWATLDIQMEKVGVKIIMCGSRKKTDYAHV